MLGIVVFVCYCEPVDEGSKVAFGTLFVQTNNSYELAAFKLTKLTEIVIFHVNSHQIKLNAT